MKTKTKKEIFDSIKNGHLRERQGTTPLPLVGYMLVSKTDRSQMRDLQIETIIAAGIPERNLYREAASGKRDDRPGLDNYLKALRSGDTPVV